MNVAKVAILVALTVAVAGPTFAAPAGPAAPRPDPAAMLLGAIDVVMTPATLAASGVTEAYANRVLQDPEAGPYLRVRAAGALGILGTDTARQTLERLAEKGTGEPLRIQAVVSLARVWGPRDEAKVGSFLRRISVDAAPPLAETISAELGRLESRR